MNGTVFLSGESTLNLKMVEKMSLGCPLSDASFTITQGVGKQASIGESVVVSMFMKSFIFSF